MAVTDGKTQFRACKGFGPRFVFFEFQEGIKAKRKEREVPHPRAQEILSKK